MCYMLEIKSIVENWIDIRLQWNAYDELLTLGNQLGDLGIEWQIVEVEPFLVKDEDVFVVASGPKSAQELADHERNAAAAREYLAG